MLAAMTAPGTARADAWAPGVCGLPTALPLRAEYAEVAVSPVIVNEVFGPARPSLVLATSGRIFPAQLRELGAHTVFWYMKLVRLIGGTSAPAAGETIEDAADRLYERAARETGCAFPTIALNELHGNWLPTPWSASNAQYRDNALRLLQRLHARGAHPYLLVTTTPRPFTGSAEAAAWWQQAAAVSDLVLQVHFDGRYIYRQGPAVASRLRRTKMRRVLDQFESIGIPARRLGLLHGFQSGSGGREGLPLSRWLRVVKWEVLATEQVVGERAEEGEPIGSDWSWGCGRLPDDVPRRPGQACDRMRVPVDARPRPVRRPGEGGRLGLAVQHLAARGSAPATGGSALHPGRARGGDLDRDPGHARSQPRRRRADRVNAPR